MARGIRGLLVRRFTWCDLWHAEIGRLREETGLPVVELHEDAEVGRGARARDATRIEALIEALRDGEEMREHEKRRDE